MQARRTPSPTSGPSHAGTTNSSQHSMSTQEMWWVVTYIYDHKTIAMSMIFVSFNIKFGKTRPKYVVEFSN